MGDLDERERAVCEKILAAHLAAKAEPRLSVDEFLRGLLTTDERLTEAYDTYDYLQGRAPAFAAFLVAALDYPDEAAALADVRSKYGEGLDARLSWYQQTGR